MTNRTNDRTGSNNNTNHPSQTSKYYGANGSDAHSNTPAYTPAATGHSTPRPTPAHTDYMAMKTRDNVSEYN